LRDVVVLVIQGAVLIGSAVIFFGLDAPLQSLLTGLAIVALLGAAFSALSYGAALKMKSEDAFAPLINGVIVPVLLLSGILLPMTLAPNWLQTLAAANPLTHIVDGVRAVFRGEIGSSESLLGAGLTVALLVVGVFYGARVFRRESA
jgi:ABC-2 type transport system permease protein